MTIERDSPFPALRALQPPTAIEAPISVAALVAGWLAHGPAVFDGVDREHLDRLCRQIDVRRKVSEGYGAQWQPLDPERPAPPAVVAGLVAVLLANAAEVGVPDRATERRQGWGLKCANSALKALDLVEDAPRAPELRGWAVEVLDRIPSLDSGGA